MTTTFDQLVHEVRASLQGFNLTRNQVTFLNGPINASVTSIVVDDASLVRPGVIEIGSECIDIQSVNTTTNTLTVSPDGRGFDLTTADSHGDNSRVTVQPSYPTWRVEQAINNTLVGVWPTLFGVGTTSFTYTPATQTYSLPADAEGVLKVSATVVGPSPDQPEIYSYKFNSAAPTAEFATGNCITLGETPEPGQTVTVIYRKVPTELASGDNLTDSGLSETARRCIVYGAVAELLSYVDAVRVLTDTAVAKEMGGDIRVGSATQLSAQLTARYQMELAKEQERLRLAYPLRVTRMGR